MRKQLLLSMFLAVAGAGFASGSSASQIIYSDLGAPTGNQLAAVYGSNYFNPSVTVQPASWAYAFNATGGSVVTQLDLALQAFSTAGSANTVTLFSDAAGLPGSVIQSWNVNAPVDTGAYTTFTGLESITGINVLLPTSGRYWLGVTPANNTSYVSWLMSSSDAASGIATIQATPNTWTPMPTAGQLNAKFDVLGTVAPPVPEPDSYALMFMGLGLLRWLVHRRERLTVSAGK